MTWEINAAQGGTITRTLTLTNDDGSMIDTTNWAWRGGLHGSRSSLYVQVDQVESGVITFTIPEESTRLLDPGVYTLGIDWTDALGNTPEEEIKATVRIERDTAR